MNTRIRASAVLRSFIAFAALSGAAAASHAAITSVTGGTTLLGSPPLACGLGQLSGFNAYAWDEQTNVSLTAAADMVNNPGSSTSAIPGVVSGLFDSHFIHFDGIAGVIGASGTVTFNNPIIGVFFNPTTLDATDGPLGALGTAYPTFYPLRGTTVTLPQSTFFINGNLLSFNLFSQGFAGSIAQMRVITHVPAPGSLALVGLAGVVAGRRRR